MDLSPELRAKLSGVIAHCHGAALGSSSDNDALLAFYNSTAMEGQSLRLRSDRSPDFFRFLRYQGPEHAVVLHRGQEGIDGLGTLAFRNGYVNGRLCRVGYLGDLRIAFRRALIREWRKCFSELLEACGDVRFLTAIIDENARAQNALIRSTKAPFRYRRLASYWMVNVLAGLPFVSAIPNSDGIACRRALATDVVALRAFLDSQHRAKAFGYAFAEGELERRFETWEGFSISSFFLALDGRRIVGCFAPWSPSDAKRNIIERVPWYLTVLRPILRIPRQGQAVYANYLTHLEIDPSLGSADRRRVFSALFRYYYAHHRDRTAHVVSFCDYSATRFHEGLGGFVLQKIPMTLFSVAHVDSHEQSIDGCEEPGFEMALV